MSRIGKNPIVVPQGVEVKFENNLLSVKGKIGELKQEIDPSIALNIDGNVITFSRSSEMPDHR